MIPYPTSLFRFFVAWVAASTLTPSALAATPTNAPPNILFVLCDDHRYDCLGVAGHPYLQTPHLDSLANEGVLVRRAYVTTSLCSPSRASILTGLYAHNHGVIDNYHPVDQTLQFFPEQLQSSGYQTAFIGKWHMGGEHDDPQRGFDHWVSFKGQGVYWADGHGTGRSVPQAVSEGYNVNGQRVPQKGYITDELTEFAIDWLDHRDRSKPFFLYMSHKAVHADFVPADRHRGRYEGRRHPIDIPTTQRMEDARSPMWVRNQRNSRHGVDFGYNQPDFDVATDYRRYCESLLAVDDSMGRLRQKLTEQRIDENTIIIYMGDNGFQFGDHGLIDKRTAYEASARVPMIVAAPGKISPGQTFDGLVANLDIAPTLLEAAGVAPLQDIDGMSVWSALCQNDSSILEGREILYEYFWERNYPHTPTIHSVIGGRYKYVRCHGIWDIDELYDLKNDPLELNNLIGKESHQTIALQMQERLWLMLQQSRGESIPLRPDRGPVFPLRNSQRSEQARFPKEFFGNDMP